jgi:hypothetical protein
MTDLTFLNAKYKNDLEFAVLRAEHYIRLYKAKTCCNTCTTEAESELHTEMPLQALKQIHGMIEAVMYSSGYWCEFIEEKSEKGYKIKAIYSIMTAEEKARCLRIPDHAQDDEDPKGMD